MLVPDADIEQAMKGLLVRTDSIDIAPMDLEIRRHVNRDSGCRTNAANFLRPYLRAYHYALVIFDRHGCGSRGTREEIQEEVEIDLTRNGWEGRSKAIVIDPELEGLGMESLSNSSGSSGVGYRFRGPSTMVGIGGSVGS